MPHISILRCGTPSSPKTKRPESSSGTRAALVETERRLSHSPSQSHRHGHPAHAHTAHDQDSRNALAKNRHPLQYSSPSHESQIAPANGRSIACIDLTPNHTAVRAGNAPMAPATLSAKGAPLSQPRATPWVSDIHRGIGGLKARPIVHYFPSCDCPVKSNHPTPASGPLQYKQDQARSAQRPSHTHPCPRARENNGWGAASNLHQACR